MVVEELTFLKVTFSIVIDEKKMTSAAAFVILADAVANVVTDNGKDKGDNDDVQGGLEMQKLTCDDFCCHNEL